MAEFKSSKEILTQTTRNLTSENQPDRNLKSADMTMKKSIDEYKDREDPKNKTSIIALNNNTNENGKEINNNIKSIKTTLDSIRYKTDAVVEIINTSNKLLAGVVNSLGQITSVISAFRADYLMIQNGKNIDGTGYYNPNLIYNLNRLFPSDESIMNILSKYRESANFANIMSNAVRGKLGNNKMDNSEGGILNGLLNKLIPDDDIKESILPLLNQSIGMFNIDDSTVNSLASSILKIKNPNAKKKYLDPLNQALNDAMNDSTSPFKQFLAGTINKYTGLGTVEDSKQKEQNPKLVLSALAPFADDIVDMTKTKIEAYKKTPSVVREKFPFAKLVWIVNDKYQENGLEKEYGNKTDEEDILYNKIKNILNGNSFNTKDEYGNDLIKYDINENSFTGTLIKPFMKTSGLENDSYEDQQQYLKMLRDEAISEKKKQNKPDLSYIEIDENGNKVRKEYESEAIRKFNEFNNSFLDSVFKGLNMGGPIGLLLNAPELFDKYGSISGMAEGAIDDAKKIFSIGKSIIKNEGTEKVSSHHASGRKQKAPTTVDRANNDEHLELATVHKGETISDNAQREFQDNLEKINNAFSTAISVMYNIKEYKKNEIISLSYFLNHRETIKSNNMNINKNGGISDALNLFNIKLGSKINGEFRTELDKIKDLVSKPKNKIDKDEKAANEVIKEENSEEQQSQSLDTGTTIINNQTTVNNESTAEVNTDEEKAKQEEQAQQELADNQTRINSEVQAAKQQQQNNAEEEVNEHASRVLTEEEKIKEENEETSAQNIEAHKQSLQAEEDAQRKELEDQQKAEIQSMQQGSAQREKIKDEAVKKEIMEKNKANTDVITTERNASNQKNQIKKTAAEKEAAKEKTHTSIITKIRKTASSVADKIKSTASKIAEGIKHSAIVTGIGTVLASFTAGNALRTGASIAQAGVEHVMSIGGSIISGVSTAISAIMDAIGAIPVLGTAVKIGIGVAAIAGMVALIMKLKKNAMKASKNTKTVTKDPGIGGDATKITAKAQKTADKGKKDAEKEQKEKEKVEKEKSKQDKKEKNDKEKASETTVKAVSNDIKKVESNKEDSAELEDKAEQIEDENNDSEAEVSISNNKTDKDKEKNLKVLVEEYKKTNQESKNKENNNSKKSSEINKISNKIKENKNIKDTEETNEENQQENDNKFNETKSNEKNEKEEQQEKIKDDENKTTVEVDPDELEELTKNAEELAKTKEEQDEQDTEIEKAEEENEKQEHEKSPGPLGVFLSFLDKNSLNALKKTMKSPIGAKLLSNPEQGANFFITTSMLPITIGLSTMSGDDIENMAKPAPARNKNSKSSKSINEVPMRPSDYIYKMKSEYSHVRNDNINDKDNKFSENVNVANLQAMEARLINAASTRFAKLIGGDAVTDANGISLFKSGLSALFGKGKYDEKPKSKEFLDASNFAKNSSYKEPDGGVYPKFFKDYLNSKNIEVEMTQNNEEVKQLLKKGQPVILMGKDESNNGETPFGDSPHYVTAIGIKNNKIIIEDSEDEDGPKLYDINKTLSHSSIKMSTNKKKQFGMAKKKKRYGGDDEYYKYGWRFSRTENVNAMVEDELRRRDQGYVSAIDMFNKWESGNSLYKEDLDKISGNVYTESDIVENMRSGITTGSTVRPSSSSSSSPVGSGSGSLSGGGGSGSGGSGSGGGNGNGSSASAASTSTGNSIEVSEIEIKNKIEQEYPKTTTSYIINKVSILEDDEVKDILKYFKELNEIQDESLEVLNIVYNKVKARTNAI